MSKLKIAIQKSGRLYDTSVQLLKDCGIRIDKNIDKLRLPVTNFPIEILYLRNSDIPRYLDDGIADIAIIGSNTLIEKQSSSKTILSLGFSKCRVSLAVPKEVEDADIQYFEGKKIATSYPNTLRNFLQEKNIKAEIHQISGSVEIAPNIGLADGICDIVSSGSTLIKNGLKETDIILQSQAVLAKSPNANKEVENVLEQLIFRIQSVLKAKTAKYILLNAPNDRLETIANILPVLKSPTVLPLLETGWSSLHSVIEEDQFWEVIDQLKKAGARDILIIPIDKMVA